MPRSSSSSSRTSVPSVPSSRRPIFPFVVIGVVLLAALTLRVVRWMRAPSEAPVQEQTIEMTGGDIDTLMKDLARHIMIPAGEAPTIATIQDVALAREQNPVLYREAQNGDRLLVWSTQLVVFSPSRDRVIAIVPVTPPMPVAATSTASLSATAATSTSSAAELYSMEIRNGTSVAGLAKRATEQFKKSSDFELLPFAAASRKDYEQTLIVVPETTSPEILQRIASVISGKFVTVLPDGEIPSKADILVILGQDASTTY
jgi:hypothetical protein